MGVYYPRDVVYCPGDVRATFACDSTSPAPHPTTKMGSVTFTLPCARGQAHSEEVMYDGRLTSWRRTRNGHESATDTVGIQLLGQPTWRHALQPSPSSRVAIDVGGATIGGELLSCDFGGCDYDYWDSTEPAPTVKQSLTVARLRRRLRRMGHLIGHWMHRRAHVGYLPECPVCCARRMTRRPD